MSDNFINEIINFAANATADVEKVRIDAHKLLVEQTISNTPRKTGMAVRNWQAEKDGIPTGIIEYAGDASAAAAQAVSEAQAKAFGTDGVFFFVNNVHYVPYLEFGTSKMAARGMARNAAKLVADNIRATYG